MWGQDQEVASPMVCSWEKITMRKQIQREFEIHQRLPTHYPRLVRVFGFSDDDDDDGGGGERGLILNYMPNGSLRAVLESQAEISMEQRARWCVEAAEAVVLLHFAGRVRLATCQYENSPRWGWAFA